MDVHNVEFPVAVIRQNIALSCRLIDLNCGGLLYGHKSGNRLLYNCGRYMNTNGAECNNNAVDAEAMFRFTIETFRELVDRLGLREHLFQRLLERARAMESKPLMGPDTSPAGTP